MVDFNKLLSPQDRADLAVYKRTVAECMARTDADMAAYATHILHNAEDPRDDKNHRQSFSSRTYEANLRFIVLPELIRRLSGGSLPQECPVCGKWIDWNVTLMQPVKESR